MNIAVARIGYVGLSDAVLLAQHNHVTAVDIQRERVEALNHRQSSIIDPEIQQYLVDKPLDSTATANGDAAYRTADFVTVTTPIDYARSWTMCGTRSIPGICI